MLDGDHVHAVTWLFVPADRPDRYAKAATSGAGAVIVDLEDAVALADKADARTHVVNYLAGQRAAGPPRTWVRVNAPAVDNARHLFEDDVDAIRSAPGLAGIVLPKLESTDALAYCAARLGQSCPVVGLVETARGVAAIHELASSGLVDRLAFGAVDFCVDLRVDEDSPLLDAARSAMVIASRTARLPAPIGPVFRGLNDHEGLTGDAVRDRSFGFRAKLLVHPGQVEAARAAFAPTRDELTLAGRILEALSGTDPTDRGPAGVGTLDGQMIDAPVAAWARDVLTRADSTHEGGPALGDGA